tara:strand:- start:2809 stop:4536 length:1728 start_codon:yes stop_codon:yes gene_type:complete
MAQHDMNIANQGFPATRADINNALQAIATNNSGTSAPSTTFANQWFYNETSNKLFIRNEANNAFIEVATLDQTNNEWQITTGQISAADSDGLVFKTDDGTTRVTLSDGGDVTFAAGTDIITASAGTDNVRIGEGAGDSIASGGNNNVTIGKNAGTAITTGDNNVAVGSLAGDAITDGELNTALGYNALTADTRGQRAVAIGGFALQNQNITSQSESYNTAVGYAAGISITTGVQNTILGALALDANTTASNNTAVGYAAYGSNTTGNKTVAVGHSALSSSTTASDSVAVGFEALQNETTGSRSTAVGYQALKTQNVGSTTQNTAVGYGSGIDLTSAINSAFFGADAGANVTTGNKNTLIGDGAGVQITSGANNTIVGRYSGNQGGLDIRTSDNHIVLSDGDGNPRVIIDSNGTLAMTTTSRVATFKTNSSSGNQDIVNIGNLANAAYTAIRFWNQGPFTGSIIGSIDCSTTATSYNTSSDYRLKENVVELTGATERLKQLKPSRFNFIADADTTVDGFLAHEVSSIVPEAIKGTKDAVDDNGNPEYQGIDQSKLVPLLVATIKELEARITALENA